MTTERRKKLLETMKEFNKEQKDSILDFSNSSEDIEVIPTGITQIDTFLGGGTKKGTFSVIYGGYSVGKSTLVLQQIANAQKEGQICCYIDLEHSFDKLRASSLGINLQELILAEKCNNAEQALEIIRKLCKEKVVDYIAIDSIQAMSPINEQENKGKERQLAEKEIAELARTLGKFFRVVSTDVFNAKASVVLIGQVRIHGIGTFYTRAGLSGGEALKHWAYQTIFMRQGQGTDAPTNDVKVYLLDKDNNLRYKTEKKKIGFDSVLKLEKTKSSKSVQEHTEVHVPFVYTEGFVNEVSVKEAEIEITGTDEEKAQIRQQLKDKGIIKSIKDCNPNITQENIERSVITSTAIEGVTIKPEDLKQPLCEDEPTIIFADKKGKEEALNNREKKKRGRPRKET